MSLATPILGLARVVGIHYQCVLGDWLAVVHGHPHPRRGWQGKRFPSCRRGEPLEMGASFRLRPSEKTERGPPAPRNFLIMRIISLTERGPGGKHNQAPRSNVFVVVLTTVMRKKSDGVSPTLSLFYPPSKGERSQGRRCLHRSLPCVSFSPSKFGYASCLLEGVALLCVY